MTISKVLATEFKNITSRIWKALKIHGVCDESSFHFQLLEIEADTVLMRAYREGFQIADFSYEDFSNFLNHLRADNAIHPALKTSGCLTRFVARRVVDTTDSTTRTYCDGPDSPSMKRHEREGELELTANGCAQFAKLICNQIPSALSESYSPGTRCRFKKSAIRKCLDMEHDDRAWKGWLTNNADAIRPTGRAKNVKNAKSIEVTLDRIEKSDAILLIHMKECDIAEITNV